MEVGRGPTSTAVGLCLLPSELLHGIFCRLALPEIHRLTTVSKSVSFLVSCNEFRRLYNQSGSGGSWVFVYKKRPPRQSILRGFNDRSSQWFHIPIAGILAPAVPPGEDLYLLASSGDFFLFSSNGIRQLIAVDLAAGAARRVPSSPLGPRGTSSWRRSGLKLVAGMPGSGEFRFLFTELCNDRPVLFEYYSVEDAWRVVEAVDEDGYVERADRACLNVGRMGSESLVLYAGRRNEAPVVLRPRFGRATAGSDEVHVYGDGCMAVIGSTVVDEGSCSRVRVIESVEVWGVSEDGRGWEMAARAPEEVMESVRKRRYGVMMVCLEESGGVIRLVVMSNLEGLWGLLWLCYDRIRRVWVTVPVPDGGTEGLNMAGIAISSFFAVGLRPAVERG